ncbi:hypothetical protein B0H11DRAFT_2257571 [Mycena galericulata]|nr:hypothetical protein B0H11DRAFT_2257571 [Mycena galericulata]
MSDMLENSPLPVSVIKPVFLDHLLSEQEMLDRDWQPITTVSNFIRERVRINVYLLQRATCGPGGLVAPRLLLSESDQSEVQLLIRRFMGTLRTLSWCREVAKMRVEGLGAPSPVSAHLVIKFGIPAQATRCFELLLMIMARFPARDEDEKLVVELMKPPLADMLIAARSIAERSGAATDFPEYGADGNIVDSDSSFDLVPLQYILPGSFVGVPFAFLVVNGSLFQNTCKTAGLIAVSVLGSGLGASSRRSDLRNVAIAHALYKFHVFVWKVAADFIRIVMPPRRASRFAVHDEFLNLDFSSPAQLYEFSRHPFIRRLTNEHLEPMVQYFLRIREDFSWTEQIKTADEKTALRQHLRSYLEHADIEFPLRSVALELLAESRWPSTIFSCPACTPIAPLSPLEANIPSHRADRIPCPKVSWLYLVIRAEQFYGFEGDEEGFLKIVLKGKLATLFAYSTALRQRSVDRLFVGDGPSRNAEAMFTLPETEFEDGEVV